MRPACIASRSDGRRSGSTEEILVVCISKFRKLFSVSGLGLFQKLVRVGIMVTHNHRVAGGSRPPPAPTERSVRISRTTLFGSCFTARRELVTPCRGDTAVVATEGTVP